MIASHDSYTYQKPKNILLNLISIFWRCQKKDINEQYKLGTRVFDIRVYRNNKNVWGTAHSFVHFNQSFDTLSDIYKYFKENFKGSIIRLYLEDNVRNNEELKNIFLKEADEAIAKYNSMIWEIGTHFPWVTYYRNKNFNPELKEYYCRLFSWDTDKSFLYNIKHINWSSWCLPLYAKKHNPTITDEMIKDNKVIHMLDYIGIYPKQ
jgi:hypothetical protein